MRLFVVGDIHGCFDLLEQELEKVNFDKNVDKLISVGDLVDRGPESALAVHYVKQPWFTAIMGNHEAMLHPSTAGSYWHVQNGGGWYNDLVTDMGKEAAEKFVQPLLFLPVFHEEEFKGKLYGFVHASLYGMRNWHFIKESIPRVDKFGENPFFWDRDEIREAMTGDPDTFIVSGVDHVYFGHTPLKQPLTVGNCTWLDTGAFATGKLTVMEIGNG